MAAFGPGPTEMMILLMFLGGFGLPLGVPPEADNPAMSHVAPAKCVLYASWAGMATPDPKSGNQTEQLLAEPEVRQFAKSLEKSLRELVTRYADESRDPQGKQLARVAPLWAKTILTRASAVFATKLETSNNEFVFEGGMLLDAGDDAKSLVDGLVQLLSSKERPADDVLIDKVKFSRIAAEKGGIGELTIGASGKLVLVGFGKGSVEGMLDRLKAKQSPAWLTDLLKRLPVERRASVSMINTKSLVGAFLPLAGPQGLRIGESLGLNQLGQMESITGLDKEGMVSRTFMKIDGDPKGLLTLLSGGGIKPKQVEFIPKDATMAAAFSLNVQQVYNIVAQVVADDAPGGAENIESAARMFEDTFGMRLKEDLLASLGNVWTISSAPADGWLGFVATVEVRDREKINELLDRVKGMVTDGPPGAPRIEVSKFGDQEIQSLAIRGMPFRVSWCVTPTRLIVGMQPQAIKSSLELKPAETGLFAQSPFDKAFKGDGEIVSVAYQDTAKVFETTYSYLTLLLPMMIDGMEGGFQPGGPARQLPFNLADLPSSRSIHRHLKPSISVTRRTKTGLESESHQTFPTPNIGASAPIGVALLLPAVQAARQAARRTQSANNMKQIMLALHNHHDTYRALPPQAITDKDGKPLLSWRVMILPFIEQQQLYQQFHLDEPWDSEHNKALIAKMPEVYKSPAAAVGEGKTVYLGVSGEKGTFPASKKPSLSNGGGLGFQKFTDGLSNTIAIVEAGNESAVTWTKPDDLVPNEKDPLKGLLGLQPGGFQVGLCDGSVRFISQAIKPATLWNLFQRDDGNVIEEF